MTTTIHDAYINALLADAAYVSNLDLATTPGDLTANLTGRMTPELAKYIGDNFTVVNQAGGLASSFDATVWKNRSGQFYISMRGTQELFDFNADADLAASGLAHDQLVDMVNWWLRETTSADQLAKQITINNVVVPGLPILQNFVAAQSVQGTGKMLGIGPIESVNGHSLGGYLASAFVRLFGTQWPAEAMNTFNSAGFSRPAELNIENGFNQITQVIGAGLGLATFSNGQNNYYAQNGINVTTNTWNPIGFKQNGIRIGMFQEDLTPGIINNHYMYKLTDLLALGDVLEQLDSTMNLTKLSALVSAGSNKMVGSYEGVLDALRRVFLGPDVPQTLQGDANEKNAGPQLGSRLDYHTNLNAIRISPALLAAAGNARVLELSKSSTETVSLTAVSGLENLAYRYALKELNSFAVVGANYGVHNQNGELNLYDDATGQGALTSNWIADRAEMLQCQPISSLLILI